MSDFDLSSYLYDLPDTAVAQHPPKNRGASRLMVLERDSGETRLAAFSELPDLLPENALLVANNSRVVPARLYGRKPSGGRVEVLLLTPLPLLVPEDCGGGLLACEAEALLKASKGPRPGERFEIAADFGCEVLARGEFGRCQVRLIFRGHLSTLLAAHGHMPLPPYIERPDEVSDRERYQTVYAAADKAGSVAAPTAGLHFTPGLKDTLLARGFGWAEVTLYVGYGTFSPVRAKDIREHRMHAEYIELPAETARAVNAAKAEGRPVVAVGTTSVRVLEGAYKACGELRAYAGWTDLFIYPGYPFKVVDALVTNFHLPGSSLLMLVSALAGREKILAAYRQALAAGFRFFSYGDALLIV